MKILSPILLAGALAFSTVAIAKDFSILNEPDGSTSITVKCRSAAGGSGTSNITLGPGQQTDIGDPQCRTYTVSIATANGTRNGHVIAYTLDAGHSYYIYWNDRNWDIAEQ
jgi:hypothetical protein